ncbi:MAG: isoamylase early set domain-containing protein [Verrucomicrobiota bacterium]
MSVKLDPKKKTVTFICDALPEATKVFLAGDFNDWDAAANRMQKVKDGSFRRKLPLKPGTYQYKFVVDGEWQADPTAENHCKNGLGDCNSVVTVDYPC